MAVAAGAAQIDGAGGRRYRRAYAARMARTAPTISGTVGLRVGRARSERR